LLGVDGLKKIGQFQTQFRKDEGGATAAEYALLLAIIAAGIGIAAGTLGGAIGGAVNDTVICVDQGPGC